MVFAPVFISGMLQNLAPYQEVTTLEGAKQVIAMGPVASQEAIKQLGTNGGGFFNGNSAHPFESPNAITNFLSMFLIFLIPAGLTYTFGRMAKDQKQGWALFGAMAFLFFAGVTVAYWAEAAGNPIFKGLPVAEAGNMEGKEVRFGIANSALYATVTTDASCGAVNSMHDSFTPLGGLVPLFNIQLGEVVFGVGRGPVRHAGGGVLSVSSRASWSGAPEYLGKKIETRDVKYAMLYALVFAFIILFFTGGRRSRLTACRRSTTGPHGLTEMLYAFSSGTPTTAPPSRASARTRPGTTRTLGPDMLFGRFWMILPALAWPAPWPARRWRRPDPALPTNGPCSRPARGRRPDRRRAHLLPRPVAGPGGRALRRPGRKGLLSHDPSTAGLDLPRPLVRQAIKDSLVKLSPT